MRSPHGHGLNLIMRDIDGGGAHAAVGSAPAPRARKKTKLGIKVWIAGSSSRKDGRLADNGPAPAQTRCRSPPESFTRLCAAADCRCQAMTKPIPTFSLCRFFWHLLRFQREMRCCCRRKRCGIERIALEDHGDAALTGREIIHHLPANQDFAGRRVLQSGDHPQKSGLPGTRRSQENHKLAFSDFQIYFVNCSELSLF